MTELSPLFAIEAEKLLEQGRVPEAIDLCKQGIEEYPGYASAFGTLAKAYKLIGEQAQLDSTIRGAMERFPLVRTVKNIKVNVDAFEPLPENELHGNEFPENEVAAEISEEITETEGVAIEIAAIEETKESESGLAIIAEEPESVAEEEVIDAEIETIDTEEEIIDAEIETIDTEEEIIENEIETINTEEEIIDDEIETINTEEEIITSEEKATELSGYRAISESEPSEPAEIKSTDLGLIPGLDFANDEPSLKPALELSDEPIINDAVSSEISIDSPTEFTSETDVSETDSSEADSPEADSSGTDSEPEITAEKLEEELLAAMKKDLELSEMVGQINELAGVAANEENRDANGTTAERDLTSETLAGILEDQGAYKEALEAYEILIETKPEKSEFYNQKIIELKSKPGMK